MRFFFDAPGPRTGSVLGHGMVRPDRAAVWTAVKWIAPIALGLLVYLLPQPDGVKPGGWAVLAIFTGTVIGLILQPLPLGAVALVGLTVTMLTGTLEPDVA